MPLPIDHELIAIAAKMLASLPASVQREHTVGAAARARSGQTFTGMNVYHFTGGPCAEMVVLGAAAGAGVVATELTTMVAVRKDDRTGNIVVINPCGRCRQTLLDYNSKMNAIVVDRDGREVTVSLRELLPFVYKNPGAADQEAGEGEGEEEVEVAIG